MSVKTVVVVSSIQVIKCWSEKPHSWSNRMIIENITLKNFRNHNYLTYDFSNNLNILTGDNAAGKTNVVEAIYYLSMARSFRTVEDADLIAKGKDRAEIDATCKEGELKRKLRIVILESGKQIFINGKKISKISDLSKCMNVLLFEPKDVMIFKGSPKVRRNFIDIHLSKQSLQYLDYISRYNQVLKERNELLKSDKVDETLLETTTEMLVKLSGPIVSYRQMYVKDINDILIKITRALTGVEGKLEIHYKPFVDYDKEFQNKALEAFRRSKENDLRQRATTIGIHREDFSISLNGRDIGEFGSQGENRIVAIALKLSPYFLIEDKDKRPVVVLDDVMSELDLEHRKRLIEFVKKFDQVFITATKLEVKGATQYQIKKKEQKEVF